MRADYSGFVFYLHFPFFSSFFIISFFLLLSIDSHSNLFAAAKARRDVENEKAVSQVVLGKKVLVKL